MNRELQDALELAQLHGCVVVEATDSSLIVLFDNPKLAASYTRRVNQANQTLTARRDNLQVSIVQEQP